jgi:hypothetical protein
MRTIIIRFTLIMAFFLSLFLNIKVWADPPGPPNPNGTPVGTGTPVGAPIDNGVIALIILGVTYGAAKLYQTRKESKEAENHNLLV